MQFNRRISGKRYIEQGTIAPINKAYARRQQVEDMS